MAIRYQYFKDKGYLISRSTGVVTVEEVKKHAQNLSQDASIDESFIEIVDFTVTEEFAFGYFEANDLVALFKPLIDSKGYKGACLVVHDDATKSMSNILVGAGRELDIPIQTFNTLEDACKYAEFNKGK